MAELFHRGVEALAMSMDLFRQVPDCKRLVADVSGDGISNEGPLS